MGTYGRGFRLANPADNGFYAPAFGGIDPGLYTGTAGFWGYNEFCEKLQNQMSEWTFVRVSFYEDQGNLKQGKGMCSRQPTVG